METTYKFQPHRYAETFTPGMYSPTSLDEQCNPYPFFADLDEAIAYMVEHRIWGDVQRFATWPYTKDPGPEPTYGNFGHRSMWFSDMLDYKRGFRAITAGVVWVSKGAPISPMTLFTTRPIETESGTLLEEIPGAFEAICKAQEESEYEQNP